jgi:hypothetical protein
MFQPRAGGSSGRAASAKGYTARLKAWALGRSRPTPETVYRVGETLRSSGLVSANGLIALYAAGYYLELIEIFAQLAIDERGRVVVATCIAALPIILSGLEFDVEIEGMEPRLELQRLSKVLDAAYGSLFPEKLNEAMRAALRDESWPTNAFERAILRSARSAASEVGSVNPRLAAYLCWLLLAEWARMVRPNVVALNLEYAPGSKNEPQWGTLASLLDPYFEAQRAYFFVGDAIARSPEAGIEVTRDAPESPGLVNRRRKLSPKPKRKDTKR